MSLEQAAEICTNAFGEEWKGLEDFSQRYDFQKDPECFLRRAMQYVNSKNLIDPFTDFHLSRKNLHGLSSAYGPALAMLLPEFVIEFAEFLKEEKRSAS